MVTTGEGVVNDVKAAYVWGQVFFGSLFSGLACWKLAHKVAHTEPSEWLSGLSTAYEGARDIVTLPLSWIHIALTSDEKSLLVICGVLLASMLRATLLYPKTAIIFFLGTVFFVNAILVVAAEIMKQTKSSLFVLDLDARIELVFSVFALLLMSIIIPVTALLIRHLGIKDVRGAGIDPRVPTALYRVILLSIIFSICWGTALLLFDWANS